MTRPGLLRLILGLVWVSALHQTACGGDDTSTSFRCGNDLTCRDGQICVEIQAWMQTFRCVENPCGSKELSCDCAASACEYAVCGHAEGRNVSCYCPTC
jgi:hypothetical protein